MEIVDTADEAVEAYVSAFERADGPQRVARAVEMADEAKTLAIAGIRFRCNELSEAEVHAEWIRLLHGDALAAAVLGHAV